MPMKVLGLYRIERTHPLIVAQEHVTFGSRLRRRYRCVPYRWLAAVPFVIRFLCSFAYLISVFFLFYSLGPSPAKNSYIYAFSWKNTLSRRSRSLVAIYRLIDSRQSRRDTASRNSAKPSICFCESPQKRLKIKSPIVPGAINKKSRRTIYSGPYSSPKITINPFSINLGSERSPQFGVTERLNGGTTLPAGRILLRLTPAPVPVRGMTL